MSTPTAVAAAGIVELIDVCTDIDDYRSAVELVRDHPDEVLDLLRVARDDDLAAVAARSYRHPNGFAKIVLHESGPEGSSVRLHVWPTVGVHEEFEDVPRGDTAPHGHRWKFASTVLAGTGLLVEEFTVDGSGALHHRFVFDPASRAELRADGEDHLTSREFWVRDRDDLYGCDTDVIHTVAPIDDHTTATLVLQGPVEETAALVFLRPDAVPDPCRMPLGEAVIASLIDEVITAMAPSTARSTAVLDPAVP